MLLLELGLSTLLVVVTAIFHGLGLLLIGRSLRAVDRGKRDAELSPLLVTPARARLWRLRCRFGDKEKKLAFGAYPEISLREARQRRDEARGKLAHGIGSASAKKAEVDILTERSRNRVSAVADEYLDHIAKSDREAVTVRKRGGCTA